MANSLKKKLIKKNFQTKEESSIAQRFIELKLEDMELSLEAKKKEQKLAERREIRQVQLDKIQEARKIIELLSSDSIEKNTIVTSILRNCYNILSQLGKDDIENYEIDNREELIHLTTKDLKDALEKTNVLEVMESAKKNGWDIRIINGQLILYKNGKHLVNDKSFVPCDKIE